MENIYRVILIKDDGIKSLYIFNHNDNIEDTDIILDKSEYEEYKELIGEKNYEGLNDDIEIHLINMNIFKDDTIETIKKKIIFAFNNSIAFEEIYLFGLREEINNNTDIFDVLSQNDNLVIDYNRFYQFLQNFVDIDIADIDLDKEEFTYDDVIMLNLDNKKTLKKFPLGSRFFIEKTYPVVNNPFDVLDFDTFLKREGEDIVSTQNKSLLLDSSKLYENNIYLCLAQDVLEFSQENELDEEIFIKLYYPYLFEENIINSSLLSKNKDKLLKKNKKMIDKAFFKSNNNVQLLYDIFKEKNKDLDYINVGITEIDFTINPKYSIILPIDLVFKLIKTSPSIPFIKFNPGKGREKIYRIYANKTSTNGKKIPYLNKASIMKLRLNMARDKSVELFSQDDDNNIRLFVNFNEKGSIKCNLQTTEYLTIEKANGILKEKINSIIDILKEFLEQRGYSFENFKSLSDSNISINRVLYNTHMTISRNIKLNKYIGCLSAVFNIIDDNLSKGIILRYKRVSYFNKMESIEAFITELALQSKDSNFIVNAIENNFKLSAEEASMKYTEWLSNIQVEQQLYENRKLKIKSNPGFPVTITKDRFTNKILIKVDNINNIELLDVIPIYIDSVLRLTQDIDSTNVERSKINKLCGTKELQEKPVIEDLESKLEENLQNNKGFEFLGESLEENKLDEDEGFFDLLDDGDISSDEEQIGGGESDDDSDEEVLEFEEATDSEDDNDDSDEDALVFEEVTPTPRPPSKKDSDDEEDSEEILQLSEGSELSKTKSKSKTKTKTKSKTKSKEMNIEQEEELKDITGLPLTNPTPFFARMKERDPVLFLQKKDGKFKAYSRSCPSNARRQPIILTDAEKERIDKESRDSYDHAVKYGSSPDKQYWYICPRYWCLKTNTSMTEEEVKAGKCGGSDKIIPRNAKKVPKDAFVYEFYAESEHKNDDGSYIKHNPGFLKQSAHPDGLCIPCCFKNWDTPAQKERREICSGKREKVEKVVEEPDDYIKRIETFPLNKDRWGELPISVQKFLHTDNTKCFQPGTRFVIKNDPKKCILRKGVEVNKNQSFIAVLADIYPEFVNKKMNTPTIKEMKEIIIDSLDIDSFISYFNGSLVNTFAKDSLSVNIENYNTSKIYKKLDLTKEYFKTHLKNICASFENFIDYLRDDDVIIDHTFLWDIVSKPNSKLFELGLNIAILEVNDADMTDNIDIICPTNNYSNEIYSSNKPTILMMKKNEFYEPIYVYRDEETRIVIKKYYSIHDNKLLPNLKNMLKVIKVANNKCLPKNSKPRVYLFKQNKPVNDVKKILKKTSFKIEKQVLNYNNKVVGLIISKDELSGYIPVKPSSIMSEYDYTFIDDQTILKDLNTTLQFLNKINKLTSGLLPIKPMIKVIDDKKIVGILTETNQFIAIDNPIDNIGFTELEEVSGINYMLSDKETLLNDKVDEERIRSVKRIHLETNFYNTFRNTARILMNKFENIGKRRDIESTLNNLSLLYTNKIEILVEKLRELLKEDIIFNDDMSNKEELLMEIENITTCMNENCDDKQYCLATDQGDKCKLVIPGKHLLSGNNNDEIYYHRLADELIRYGLIRNFMMKPKVYLSIEKVDYDLEKDEIILLDTILTTGYFDDLTEKYQNKYITNNIMEFIQPLQSQIYNNEYDESDMREIRNKRVLDYDCIETTNKIKGIWGKEFNDLVHEHEYINTPDCTFNMIINIISDFKNEKPSKNTIKKILLKKYEELVIEYDEDKILKMILKDQGKEFLVNQVLYRKINLEQMIMSDDYYLTNLDIIIIGMHYEAPIVIVTGTKLKELLQWKVGGLKVVLETKENATERSKKQKKMWIVNNKQDPDFYYFIKQPGIKRNEIPKYKIMSRKEEIRVNRKDMKSTMNTLLALYKKRPTFEQYIENYKPIYVKPKTKKLKLKASAPKSGSKKVKKTGKTITLT